MKSILKIALTTHLAVVFLLFSTAQKSFYSPVNAQTIIQSNSDLLAQKIDLQEIQKLIEQNPELWQQAQQLLQQNPQLVQQLIEQIVQQNPDLVQQIQQNPQLMQQAAQQGQVLIQLLLQNPQLLERLQKSLQSAQQGNP